MQITELGHSKEGQEQMTTSAPGFAIEYEVEQGERTPAPSAQTPINVASVRHRSPFRYPGGKTWLVPHVRQWLWSLNPPIERFVEPFAGGAIVGLSALLDRFTRTITLIEKDTNVAAVWETISKGDALELASRIVSFNLTEKSVDELFNRDLHPADIVGRAFLTIIRNRVQRGGIMAPGAGVIKTGENGKGIRSRWYPETLKNRLVDLHQLHEQMQVECTDGIAYMRSNANKDFVWFIDPPYTVAGRRLYVHSLVDHAELFAATADLAGPFLMTYDDSEEIRELARKHGFAVGTVAMKNTHHAVMQELLISSDLRWLRG